MIFLPGKVQRGRLSVIWFAKGVTRDMQTLGEAAKKFFLVARPWIRENAPVIRFFFCTRIYLTFGQDPFDPYTNKYIVLILIPMREYWSGSISWIRKNAPVIKFSSVSGSKSHSQPSSSGPLYNQEYFLDPDFYEGIWIRIHISTAPNPRIRTAGLTEMSNVHGTYNRW